MPHYRVEGYMTPVNAGVHVRENLGVLARAERRALLWIAARLPHQVNSDHLSALGLVSMAAAGLSFAAYPLSDWAALGVVLSLGANWFGDSLDGTVARARDQQRPRYGFYVDHVIDLAGSALLLAGMACSGLMSPLVALAVLAAYLLVSAESYLATHAAGTFRMSFLGVGPAELRIVIAIGALRAAVSPWVSIGTLDAIKLFDVGGSVGAAGLLFAFIVSSIRNTRALYAADPMPARRAASRAA
jgi:phosphatidylglycerophosphate synthase